MQNKKEAPPPMVETGGGKGEQLTISAELFPIEDYNTGQRETAIASVLPKGLENAIPGPALARIIGCEDLRSLRRKITQERISGAIILSLPEAGYFLPDDGEKGVREVEMYLAVMDARTVTTERATEAARRFVRGGGG